MRSEKELRDRVEILRKLEYEEAQYIQELVEDGDNTFLECVMTRANAIQSERTILEWVLDETMD